MSEIRIAEVNSKSDRKEFITFPMKLYARCPYYVPPLILDEMDNLSPEKNPAFETADVKLLLAYNGPKVVGRIAGIISHAKNEAKGERNIRFGWFDSIDDARVSTALFGAVEDWGRSQGMNTFTGPHGFNEFDKAGMLVEGFDSVPTMATYYNFAYYPELVTQYGFEKEIDWVEYLVGELDENSFPPRLAALAEKVQEQRGYRVLEFANKKELQARAPEVLELILDAYEELHSYTPITDKQKPYYIKKFFPFLNPNFVKVVVNDRDEVIGVFIALPSISKALQKAKGRLLPFGIFHLLKATRNGGGLLDLAIGGVRKEYRGRGVDVVMACAMHKSATSSGYRMAETNPELEDNVRVRSQWKHFKHVQHRRRRLYIKPIGPAQN